MIDFIGVVIVSTCICMACVVDLICGTDYLPEIRRIDKRIRE